MASILIPFWTSQTSATWRKRLEPRGGKKSFVGIQDIHSNSLFGRHLKY
jgi:hypothetical protein